MRTATARFGSLAAAALLTLGNVAIAAPPASLPLPEDWYPESVAAGADGSLYVGSWRQGAIARVQAGKAPQIIVPPGSNGLSNGQGVLVDAQQNLLWICSGTAGFTTVAVTPSALKSYDLHSGAPRGSYAMPDAGYCNDLVQDEDGSIYVSDSLHPRILRWRRGDTALSIWKEEPALAPGAEGYYFNGIASDGGHGFYVAKIEAVDYLFHIDKQADGSAGALTRVPMPRVLKNADGLRSDGPGRLVIFESNAFGNNGPYGGQITLARFDAAGKASLQTLVAGLNDPSGGAIAKGRVYFIESKYGLLFAHKNDDAAIPRHVPFTLDSVALPR